eukprot:1377658-Prymnesium_polylepis.1
MPQVSRHSARADQLEAELELLRSKYFRRRLELTDQSASAARSPNSQTNRPLRRGPRTKDLLFPTKRLEGWFRSRAE